jgi:hypothetical protein
MTTVSEVAGAWASAVLLLLHALLATRAG